MQNKFHFTKDGEIRIISGKWKGRKIPVICRNFVRPTLSRIRETLFNWMNPIIYNTICLDCFAGSGALGLESLSRGSKKVTFIDKNNICIVMLNKIKLSFKEYKSEVIYDDCRLWLKKSYETYDIIFIDPPFCNLHIILEVVFLLEQYNHFKKKSWIYIETYRHGNGFDFKKLPKNWCLYRAMATKNILCYLYLREEYNDIL